jgi:hypothetical protein
MSELEEIRRAEYARRLVAERLRRELFALPDPNSSPELAEQLTAAELELNQVEQSLVAAVGKDPESGLVLDTSRNTGLLGSKTTGLEVRVTQRMSALPTAIYHLLDPNHSPLITVTIRNADEVRTRRLRVISYLERYSAQAVDTLELAPRQSFTLHQLPVLFTERAGKLTELTRAALNILVEDLEGSVELHRSQPVWLLSHNTAPLAVRDPQTGAWIDLSIYFAAFVTPNAPAVRRFLRLTAEHHPQRKLVGYQGESSDIILQVRAAYDALKTESRITYINSVLEFSPDQGFSSQRVRLPRESLEERAANCIDGTVLLASLLEAISLSPALVIVPGHAFLAWETWENSGEWSYLETTMIATHTFEEAVASGEATARRYQELAQKTGQPLYFRRHALRELRGGRGITPLE